MGDVISIAHNAVNAKLYGASRDALLCASRLLSYEVAGAAFKSPGWSGKSSFFDYATATFPAGFVELVTRGLRGEGFEIRIARKPLPEPLGPRRPEVDSLGYADRYDYQAETVDRLIEFGMMIARVATGGGKSRICRIAYRRINRPTLFLTTRGILMHQMRDSVVAMGEEVAILGDGSWGIEYKRADGTTGRRLTKFCVGMVQTLSQRLEVTTVDAEVAALNSRRSVALSKQANELKELRVKQGVLPHMIGIEINKLVERVHAGYPTLQEDREKLTEKVARQQAMRNQTIKVLERFELVIAEEAHEVSGTGFFDVMGACRNANYRLALTATPFMKEDEEANMRLMATCGHIGITVSEKLLIDRGILARPYFKFLHPGEKPTKLLRSTPWQSAYSIGIVKNTHRNLLMCEEVLRAASFGLNALMLVQYKEHGVLLKAMLEQSFGLRAEFIDGDSSQDQRKLMLGKLSSGNIDVLIGSTIMDVGVDVPSIGMIVLAGGGKAEVALRQRIGRGLREKKGGRPNVAFIVDVSDGVNNHLIAHAKDRRQVICSTEGFGENVVRDFDFVELGLTKVA